MSIYKVFVMQNLIGKRTETAYGLKIEIGRHQILELACDAGVYAYLNHKLFIHNNSFYFKAWSVDTNQAWNRLLMTESQVTKLVQVVRKSNRWTHKKSVSYSDLKSFEISEELAKEIIGIKEDAAFGKTVVADE